MLLCNKWRHLCLIPQQLLMLLLLIVVLLLLLVLLLLVPSILCLLQRLLLLLCQQLMRKWRMHLIDGKCTHQFQLSCCNTSAVALVFKPASLQQERAQLPALTCSQPLSQHIHRSQCCW